MPKVKGFTKPYEKENEAIRRAIKARIALAGMSRLEMSQRLGISTVTLAKRLGNPDSFTLREIRRLEQALHISFQELREGAALP